MTSLLIWAVLHVQDVKKRWTSLLIWRSKGPKGPKVRSLGPYKKLRSWAVRILESRKVAEGREPRVPRDLRDLREGAWPL